MNVIYSQAVSDCIGFHSDSQLVFVDTAAKETFIETNLLTDTGQVYWLGNIYNKPSGFFIFEDDIHRIWTQTLKSVSDYTYSNWNTASRSHLSNDYAHWANIAGTWKWKENNQLQVAIPVCEYSKWKTDHHYIRVTPFNARHLFFSHDMSY